MSSTHMTRSQTRRLQLQKQKSIPESDEKCQSIDSPILKNSNSTSICQSQESNISNKISNTVQELLSQMEDLDKLTKDRIAKLEQLNDDLLKTEKEIGVKSEQLLKLNCVISKINEERKLLKHESVKLKKENTKIRKAVISFDQLIRLDIGGFKCTTSLSTLTRGDNHFFKAMFSGRFAMKPNSDGHYFIDRDGEHFKYILNYLRDGSNAVMPTNEHILACVKQELNYYSLIPSVRFDMSNGGKMDNNGMTLIAENTNNDNRFWISFGSNIEMRSHLQTTFTIQMKTISPKSIIAIGIIGDPNETCNPNYHIWDHPCYTLCSDGEKNDLRFEYDENSVKYCDGMKALSNGDIIECKFDWKRWQMTFQINDTTLRPVRLQRNMEYFPAIACWTEYTQMEILS